MPVRVSCALSLTADIGAAHLTRPGWADLPPHSHRDMVAMANLAAISIFAESR
jgi:hypothetical protein